MSIERIKAALADKTRGKGQYAKVIAGTVADVARGITAPDRIRDALLKGAEANPAEAEVWQSADDLFHLIELAEKQGA